VAHPPVSNKPREKPSWSSRYYSKEEDKQKIRDRNYEYYCSNKYLLNAQRFLRRLNNGEVTTMKKGSVNKYQVVQAGFKEGVQQWAFAPEFQAELDRRAEAAREQREQKQGTSKRCAEDAGVPTGVNKRARR
jgi:hypothetical protein